MSLKIPLSHTIGLSVCVCVETGSKEHELLSQKCCHVSFFKPLRLTSKILQRWGINKERATHDNIVCRSVVYWAFLLLCSQQKLTKEIWLQEKEFVVCFGWQKINVLQKCWFWLAFVSSEFPVQFFSHKFGHPPLFVVCSLSLFSKLNLLFLHLQLPKNMGHKEFRHILFCFESLSFLLRKRPWN